MLPRGKFRLKVGCICRWYAAALLAAALSLMVPPLGPAAAASSPSTGQGAEGAGDHLQVIRKGDTNKQAVTLMINVDWGAEELAKMLPVLKQQGAKVTFFVSGTWAKNNEALLRQMAADGHEIATHGHRLTHGPKDLARMGRLKEDIAQSVAVIQGITGQTIHFYAPHMSEISPVILETAASLQLRTVLPSVDTIDWDNGTTQELILRRLAKAGPGDLVLMHPKPNTAAVLETALKQLEQRGLKPLTLGEMLGPTPQATPAEHE